MPLSPSASTSTPQDAARYFALVPCAGAGSRAGTARPKQYQNVAGQPLVMHTLWALAGVARLHAGLVVLSPGDDFAWPQGVQWPERFSRASCGGESRAHSVFNGLQALRAAVAREHLIVTGDPLWARYDPPFKPWFLRTNEILLAVPASTVEPALGAP